MKVACQTPKKECTGGLTAVNNNLVGQGSPRKLHSSSEEAFQCYSSFLLRNGYTQVGSREFRQPDGGILMLSKRSRYGAVMRKGKSDTGKAGNRFMPRSGRKHCTNGIIIG